MPVSMRRALFLSALVTINGSLSAARAQSPLYSQRSQNSTSRVVPSTGRFDARPNAGKIELLVIQNDSNINFVQDNVATPVQAPVQNEQPSVDPRFPNLRPQDPLTAQGVDGSRTAPINPSQMPDANLGPITLPDLNVPNTSIERVGTGLIPTDATQGRLPPTQPLPLGLDRPGWSIYQKPWAAAPICHHPLYFQDTMRERHGHERMPLIEPYLAGARFFGTLPLMPYLMTLHPPCEDIYNLGHYRPGTAAPLLRERPPYDRTALGVQTITTAGAFVAMPL